MLPDFMRFTPFQHPENDKKLANNMFISDTQNTFLKLIFTFSFAF